MYNRIEKIVMAVALVVSLTLVSGSLVVCAADYIKSNSVSKTEAKQEVTVNNPKEIEVVVTENYIPADTEWKPILPENVANLPEVQKPIAMLAQLMYGEARGLNDYERGLVAWCVLNRVDNERFPNDIVSVITAPNQFYYKSSFPVTEDNYNLAKDIVMKWSLEKTFGIDTGRTLPSQYLFFYGDGKHNYFRDYAGGKFEMEDM